MLGAVMLAGCDTMTVAECKVADWGRVGFADGARGESESRLAAHTESCAQAGVTPHAQAYRQGWDAGILRFCTAASGWHEGVQGASGKETVCRGQPGYEAFARYLDAGLQVYRTNAAMRHNFAESKRLQKKLEETASDDDKRRLRDELHHMDHEQSRLRQLLSLQQMLAP